jgi:hypothetical protein
MFKTSYSSVAKREDRFFLASGPSRRDDPVVPGERPLLQVATGSNRPYAEVRPTVSRGKEVDVRTAEVGLVSEFQIFAGVSRSSQPD